MKNQISLGIAALALTASSAAFADARVRVDINPFGYWGAPPPVVYTSPRYYAPVPVYSGRGHYYGDRDWRGRGDRGRSDRGGDDHRR